VIAAETVDTAATTIIAGVDSGATAPTSAVPASNDVLILRNDQRFEQRAKPTPRLAAWWPACRQKNHDKFERSRLLGPHNSRQNRLAQRNSLWIFQQVLRKYYAVSL